MSPAIKFKRFLFEDQKYFFLEVSLVLFFLNGFIHNAVFTLQNVMKMDIKNDVTSMLFEVVQINVDIGNVDLTLLNVVNSNVDVHKLL